MRFLLHILILINFKGVLCTGVKEDSGGKTKVMGTNKSVSIVEFTSSSASVKESSKKVRMGLRRTGNLTISVVVGVETVQGTALAGEDYEPLKDKINFSRNEQLRQVFVELVDDFEWEPAELFFLKLYIDKNDENSNNVILGNIIISQITILNDDKFNEKYP